MNDMTAGSDIHALSGAYAVDALDTAERTEFERHLAACAACRAEVASFHETTALIAETTTDTPPASLREGVLAGIREVRPLPPQTPETGEPAPERTGAQVIPLHRRVLPRLLATAAAFVLLAAGLLVWHPWAVVEEQHRRPGAARARRGLVDPAHGGRRRDDVGPFALAEASGPGRRGRAAAAAPARPTSCGWPSRAAGWSRPA